jgi:hypothetical protein
MKTSETPLLKANRSGSARRNHPTGLLLALASAVALAVPVAAKPDARSPSGKIIVEHSLARGGNEADDHEIWLVSAEDQTKRQLLFRHHRNAEVVFSPDENWLIINNHAGSGFSGVLLYRRKAVLDYAQVADLTEAAWKFFKERNGLAANPFDHAYADALCWISGDPPVLLIGLGGHTSGPAGVLKGSKGWYCLYDVLAKSFSTDFDALNKKNTKLDPE